MGNISELERRISIRIILEDAEIIFALLSSEQDIRVSHKRNVSNTKKLIHYLFVNYGGSSCSIYQCERNHYKTILNN